VQTQHVKVLGALYSTLKSMKPTNNIQLNFNLKRPHPLF
jgi:hypothetical protein